MTMTQEGHNSIHSFVPVYSAFCEIRKLAISGINNGSPIELTNTQLKTIFNEISQHVVAAQQNFMVLEQKLACPSGNCRRSYDKQKEAV